MYIHTHTYVYMYIHNCIKIYIDIKIYTYICIYIHTFGSEGDGWVLRCSVLQCVAVYDSVLQCVAVCCSLLQIHTYFWSGRRRIGIVASRISTLIYLYKYTYTYKCINICI